MGDSWARFLKSPMAPLFFFAWFTMRVQGQRKYALGDKLVPGYREALTAPCAVCQIEVDKCLIRYADILRLRLEIGDCVLGEFNRHLLLELLGVGVLLPFAEIVFFPHVPFLTFCNGSLRSLWLSWPR